MTPRTVHREVIRGPAGALEIALQVPQGTVAGLALVAHPHPQQGGTLENKVVQTLAKAFVTLGYAALRFNFRGVGASEGAFDDGNGETEDALAALTHGQARFGADLPVILGGFSFGSFVQSRVAKRITAQRLVLVGPAVGRFAVESVAADTIVVHGEEDDVVSLSDVLAWARPQELPIVVFPGCGHFFHGRLPQLQRTVMTMMGRPPS